MEPPEDGTAALLEDTFEIDDGSAVQLARAPSHFRILVLLLSVCIIGLLLILWLDPKMRAIALPMLTAAGCVTVGFPMLVLLKLRVSMRLLHSDPLRPEQMRRVLVAEQVAPQQPGMQNPLIQERIQQLNERTRICSRRVWEEVYLPELRGPDGAAQTRDATTECCVCMTAIAMDAQIRGLACGHIFHLPCLAEWFMRDRTFDLCCPLCRTPLEQQIRFQDWDPLVQRELPDAGLERRAS